MHRSGAEQRAWFGGQRDLRSSLASHQGANDVVTNAGALPAGEGENSIRAYFVGHPQEWADLQGIAQPLRSLRLQCNVDVAPAQIARLFDAMAS